MYIHIDRKSTSPIECLGKYFTKPEKEYSADFWPSGFLLPFPFIAAPLRTPVLYVKMVNLRLTDRGDRLGRDGKGGKPSMMIKDDHVQ